MKTIKHVSFRKEKTIKMICLFISLTHIQCHAKSLEWAMSIKHSCYDICLIPVLNRIFDNNSLAKQTGYFR